MTQPTEITELAAQVAAYILPEMEGVVSSGIRKGRLPEYLRTSRAVAETGLSARSLKHLRETSQISYHKQRGVILYRTRDLLAELAALRVPARTNSTT